MLTYQLQDRRLVRKAGESVSFPVDARLQFRLEPSQLFGAGAGPLRLILIGSDHHVEYDANTGKSYDHPEPPVPPLSATAAAIGGEFSLQANVLSFRFRCSDEDTLRRHTEVLFYSLPPVLSAFLPEPVQIVNTSCWLGQARFNLELMEARVPMSVCSKEGLEDDVARALSSLSVCARSENRRLIAALHYAHTARRLLAAGSSPWEFAAEAMLSFNKVLEVLFGDSRDQIREGLAQLGYDNHAIEAGFIPLTLLRDCLDVAHPRLAVLKDTELGALHLYVVGLEPLFHQFIRKLCEAVRGGSYSCVSPGPTDLSGEEQQRLNRILGSIAT